MKSIRHIITALFLIGFAFGCASGSGNQSRFTADTVPQIKSGMTKDQVTAIIGQPRSRSLDNEGIETWQYRKNGTEGAALKTYANIASFGLTSGQDAQYQDILTVTFKSNVVSKVTYQENVQTPNALIQQ